MGQQTRRPLHPRPRLPPKPTSPLFYVIVLVYDRPSLFENTGNGRLETETGDEVDFVLPGETLVPKDTRPFVPRGCHTDTSPHSWSTPVRTPPVSRPDSKSPFTGDPPPYRPQFWDPRVRGFCLHLNPSFLGVLVPAVDSLLERCPSSTGSHSHRSCPDPFTSTSSWVST